MPVYLLAPIILPAAQAIEQHVASERSIGSPDLLCCAATSHGGGLNFQLGANPSSGGASAVEVPPVLWAGLGSSGAPAQHAPLAPATASTSIAGPAVVGPTEDPTLDPVKPDDPYTFRVFRDQAKSVKWRFAGAAAAITAGGFANWNWGSSRFRFNSEGWFGKETASLGMDKLGHAYSAYVLTEFFSDGIKKRSADDRSGSYTGAILAMGLMTYI